MRRLLFLIAACSGDAPPSTDATPPADSGSCVAASTTCTGDVLSTCVAGGNPVQEICGWGCEVSACKRIVPTGGGATADDLLPATLAGFGSLSVSGTLDGSTGRLNGIDVSTMNIGYSLESGVAVFRFQQLAVGGLKLNGTVPIQLVADGAITINGTLDATGSCGTGAPEIAGAGGGNGGQTSGVDGALVGGGIGGASVGGGGGGGWGGTGGVSGGGALGGASSGDPVVTLLRGGAGGGAGGGTVTFQGGGGGGAIQLISNTRITITGNINAGGCGGRRGTVANDEGGGGGAGGSIVFEAPEVTLVAGRVLAVNGGGGGGGGGTGATDGGAGPLSRNRAVGGNAGANGGAGGAGGAAAILDGAPGIIGTRPGGGGGAVGRIRIHTRAAAVIDGVMSPALDDPASTATQGTATLQ